MNSTPTPKNMEEKPMGKEARTPGQKPFDLSVDANVQEWRQSWTEWDRAEQWGAFDLGHCKTIDEVLDWLVRIGEQFLVCSARLYFVSTDGLFLTGCAGHDDETTIRLRQSMRMEKSIDNRESFYCFDVGRPVLCQVDLNVKDIVELEDRSEMIAAVRAFDRCGKILGTGDKRVYVDIPIYFCGEKVAKLSCDFCVTNPELLEVEQIEAFCRLSQTAGYVLYAMRNQAFRTQERKERARIAKINSPKDVYEYVESYLPGRLGCKSAKFFELRSDIVPGGDIVRVLALMTKQDESVATESPHYRYRGLTSRHLIPLVAALKKTIVLSNVEVEDLRDKECEAQGLKVDWNDPVFGDWKGMGSVMLVPLFNSILEGDAAMGVLVLSGKHPHGWNETACFNALDQRLAERLMNEGLAPKAEVIGSFSHFMRTSRPFLREDIYKLQDSGKNFADAIIDSLKRTIPEKKTKKLYAVCEANHGWTKFDILAIDGKLDDKASRRTGIWTTGTITLAALRAQWGKPVYRNIDEEDWRGQITRGSVCELACSISGRHGPKRTVVVKSNEYDLSLEEYGSYLENLATGASATLLAQEPA